jgi:hypothetical protein
MSKFVRSVFHTLIICNERRIDARIDPYLEDIIIRLSF